MSSTEITFINRATRLSGTLTAPAGAAPGPAVLLISGSGPLDRDSNVKKLRIDVMRQVAEHLAGIGVASLRFDKRGVGASDGEYMSSGFHDNVADAQAALETLCRQPEVDPAQVFVLGHSEGALIATELAARNPYLAGAILLAGTATSGEAVLRWQAAQVAATLPRPVRILLKLLRKDVPTMQAKRLAQLKATRDDVVRIQLVKVNAKWFREFMVHDPAQSLRTVAIPVLAITGSKDIQVDAAHAARICEMVPSPCTHHVLDDMSHLLRVEPGSPTLRTYKRQAKQPVDPNLLALVSSWIGDRARCDAAVPCGEDAATA